MSIDRDEMWQNFAAHPCTAQLRAHLAKIKIRALVSLRGAAAESPDAAVRGYAEQLTQIEHFELVLEGKMR